MVTFLEDPATQVAIPVVIWLESDDRVGDERAGDERVRGERVSGERLGDETMMWANRLRLWRWSLMAEVENSPGY
jgi:hypothetical protein